MLSSTVYDVIIIGAGPGGSLTGYLLSRQGLKVLIVEKEQLPRYKPCAGGLTRRALNILPFDISDVVEDHYLPITFQQRTRWLSLAW
jgi:flavin-dependent dehydrogenase